MLHAYMLSDVAMLHSVFLLNIFTILKRLIFLAKANHVCNYFDLAFCKFTVFSLPLSAVCLFSPIYCFVHCELKLEFSNSQLLLKIMVSRVCFISPFCLSAFICLTYHVCIFTCHACCSILFCVSVFLLL